MEQQLVYIETFGCQMNERDSEIMGRILERASYHPTGDLSAADLILLNTCSIRAKAEQKMYSLLGRLAGLKKHNPSLIITVAGCVAQQEGKKLPTRQPLVDIVVGTQQIYRLPELIEKVKQHRRPQVEVGLAADFTISPSEPHFSPAPLSDTSGNSDSRRRFVTIMQGCNNFCAYCVVPYTRGREISRSPADIVSEIKQLAAAGVKEVTLLGQNVNSYAPPAREGSGLDFPGLLRLVAQVEGISRIRFTTSHPKDLSPELMLCFAELDKLCPHLHLPVQSGSNRVLKAMHRRYTVEQYLEKIASLRQHRPDIALTTDIIVGFPGETEADFAATMALLERIRYHGAFSFKYSDRPGTRAASLAGKVPEEEKTRRLAFLQARQEEITLERNREYIGGRLEVLTEGEGGNSGGQWRGRTRYNQVVNFSTGGGRPGPFTIVEIREGLKNSLRGRQVASGGTGVATAPPARQNTAVYEERPGS